MEKDDDIIKQQIEYEEHLIEFEETEEAESKSYVTTDYKLTKYSNQNSRKKISKSRKNIKLLIAIICVIIVVIVILMAVALFFITMPSMIASKTQELNKSLGKKVLSWFGNSSTGNVEELDMYNIINYFSDMGYDLKGYGFLTNYMGTDSTGIVTDGSGKIVKAESDFLYTYLMSDTSIYSINTGRNADYNFWDNVSGVAENFKEFLKRGNWNKGFISIYRDSGQYGIKQSPYIESGFNSSDVSVDFDKMLLSIKKNTYDDTASKLKINGWSGKYGKPLEFLISLHLSTMMPDLSYEIVTKFPTEVSILMHSLGATPAVFYSPDGSSYMSRDEVISSFHAESCDCIKTGDTIISRGSNCQAVSNSIVGVMDGAINRAFGAYEPYIANVSNHWYRDIFFVANAENKKFVKYDDTYQDLMNERWTLYNVDGSGNKKAQTFDISEQAESYNWNEYGGVWTSYKEKAHGSSSGYIAAYPGAGQGTIESSVYLKVSTSKNISQSGDGQRTETNNEIKKIFLDNSYFRYDGSKEKAEVITALRKQYDIPYGALSSDILNKTYTLKDSDGNIILDKNGNEKKYRVKDYAGKISIEQDCLNTFSMLENIHTVDSDYIYRDFKELIVELGYYSKEELTDEIPRVLGWIVPRTGSYNYPKRELDKDDNEFGTMIHSKKDLEAYVTESERSTNAEKVSNVLVVENPEDLERQVLEVTGYGDLNMGANLADDEEFHSTQEVKSQFVSECNGKKTADIVQQEIAGSDGHPKINSFTQSSVFSAHGVDNAVDYIISLGGIFEKYGKMYKNEEKIEVTTVEQFQEVSEYVFGIMVIYGFDYCANCEVGHERHTYFRATDTPSGAYSYNYNNQKKGGPGKIIESAIDRNIANVCCNWGVDLVYFKAGLFGNKGQPRSSCNMTNLMNCGGQEVTMVEDLQVGDIVQCFENPITDYGIFGDGKRNTYKWFHVCYVGEVNKEEGYLVLYDSGHFFTNSGNYKNKIYYDSTDGTVLHGDSQRGGAKWVGIHLFDLDGGGSKEYEGYDGNDAVISPVTGILLEYEKYKKNEDIDSITNKSYRINTDLRSGKCDINNTDNYRDNIIDNYSEEVGYAKILVLDDENYQKLEKYTNNRWKNNSLLTENGDYLEEQALKQKDDLDNWSQTDKTVYGYKEFAENYKEVGIQGYEIFIDGFKCEVPGKENDDGTIETEQELSMDYFIEMARKTQFVEDPQEELQNSYTKDQVYGLSREENTEKSKAESKAKELASQAVYLEQGEEKFLIIKEGMVIGRTYTDREIYDSRDNEYKEKIKFDEEDLRAKNLGKKTVAQGNYLRIMLRDKNGELVENVEEYMKVATIKPRKIIKKFAITQNQLAFMAGIMTEEAGSSDEGLIAMAWIIRNRLVSGRFDEALSIDEVLITFDSVSTRGGEISIEVNDKKYYTSSSSDRAKEIAEKVLKGEIENPIEERCYRSNTNVSEDRKPIKISGSTYYY